LPAFPASLRPFQSDAKAYQPGEKDVSGRISKISDRGLPMALYEAAHIILTRPVEVGALKSWAMRLSARAGKNKATEQRVRRLDQSSKRGWTNHDPLQKSISQAGRTSSLPRRATRYGVSLPGRGLAPRNPHREIFWALQHPTLTLDSWVRCGGFDDRIS